MDRRVLRRPENQGRTPGNVTHQAAAPGNVLGYNARGNPESQTKQPQKTVSHAQFPLLRMQITTHPAGIASLSARSRVCGGLQMPRACPVETHAGRYTDGARK